MFREPHMQESVLQNSNLGEKQTEWNLFLEFGENEVDLILWKEHGMS